MIATSNTADSNRSRFISNVPLWLLAAFIAVAATGCGLTKPAGASFASVKIKNATPQQIQAATVEVFREDGYVAFDAGPGQMVFQREASKMTNIGQNGLVESHYGAQTAIRIRAQIVDLGTGAYRLQCRAYIVRNPGDSFFEDEHPMVNARRMPYQHLLNQVARKLG